MRKTLTQTLLAAFCAILLAAPLEGLPFAALAEKGGGVMLIGRRNAMLAGGSSQPSGGYWGLCFTAEQANSTVAMVANGSAPSVSLLYSTDAANWSPFVVGTTTVTLASVGDKVWIKAGTGGNTAMASGTNSYNGFSLSGRIAASGSVMSLLNSEEEALTIPANYGFVSLFNSCSSLTAAPALPAETLKNSCYQNMFRYCSSITVSPDLPASTLKSNCYTRMFQGCSSLATIRLNSTTKLSGTFSAYWVDNVAATGTFYCPTALGTDANITRGTSACPAGWTVVNTDA